MAYAGFEPTLDDDFVAERRFIIATMLFETMSGDT
jgi:hypothetical protein